MMPTPSPVVLTPAACWPGVLFVSRPIHLHKKLPSRSRGVFGAGGGNRTRVSRLETSNNSRYTTPAGMLLTGELYQN